MCHFKSKILNCALSLKELGNSVSWERERELSAREMIAVPHFRTSGSFEMNNLVSLCGSFILLWTLKVWDGVCFLCVLLCPSHWLDARTFTGWYYYFVIIYILILKKFSPPLRKNLFYCKLHFLEDICWMWFCASHWQTGCEWCGSLSQFFTNKYMFILNKCEVLLLYILLVHSFPFPVFRSFKGVVHPKRKIRSSCCSQPLWL